MTARKPAGKAPVKKPAVKKPAAKKAPVKAAPKKKAPIKKAVAKKPHAPRSGRPSKYTETLADALFASLARGQSLRSVCKDESMPSEETFFQWMRTKPDFPERYARAKQESADAMFEEIQDIADDGRNDWMEKIGPDGESQGWVHNGEHIQRSKLRVDTRKWMMAKMKPKKYGDRLDVDVRQTNAVDVLNEALARAGVKPE